MPMLRRLAPVLAGSLVLASCAVPGQAGAPGVLAEYEGRTVTAADVDAMIDAWEADTGGALVPTRPEVATYAVLGPDLLEASADVGYTITEADGLAIASVWLQSLGIAEPAPSDEVIEIARAAAAAYILVASDPSLALVEETAGPAEEGVYSPRLGEFDATAFAESARRAHSLAVSTGNEQIAFTQYLDASGFVAPDSSWAARG